jgi:Fe-Mn family superoxide dismutase
LIFLKILKKASLRLFFSKIITTFVEYINLKIEQIMTHQMPKLPYTNDGLEAVISKQTIDFHYGKHLQTYVNNLNNLIKGTEFEEKTLEEIVSGAPEGGIFNNAGQVLNHTLYFLQFTSNPLCNHPSGKLDDAIYRDFGNFETFKEEFSAAAITLFGSGWAWLSHDIDGKLVITKEANANNPLKKGLTPLLCFDVWEHAYYLDYQNLRAEYIHDLWSIINWKTVESRVKW